MLLKSLLFVSPLLLAVKAQDTTSSYTSGTTYVPSTSTSAAFTHTVSVAYAGFTFSPDVTLADVGDVIEFDFYPTNHSVVRAEWEFPCIPYEDTGVDKVGFFSGFKPVGEILPSPPTFSITINDTNPIFYYCSAPGSCINHGMVGVINPNGTTPIDTQIALARNSSFMLQPGQAWPSEENDPFSGSSTASATVAPTSTKPAHPATTTPVSTAPASTTTAAAASSSSHSGLSAGAIAGIAIGAAAIALIAAAMLYMCGRHSRKRYSSAQQSAPNMSTGHTTPSMTYIPGSQHLSFVPSPHNKHNSTMSSTTSPMVRYGSPPPLPGYIPQHDPAMSPPLQHSFPAPIDNSVNGEHTSDSGLPSSPSPSNQGFVPGAAPAYNQHPGMMPTHQMPMYYVPVPVSMTPPHGVHEMDSGHGRAYVDPNLQQQQQQPNGGGGSGILNFIRKSGSTKKAGEGVERYG